MKNFLFTVAFAAAFLIISACSPKGDVAPTGKVIKSATVGNLTVTLSNDSGVLKHGNQEFIVTFTDSAGKPVDVGAVALTFHMPQMGSMQEMNDATTFTTTNSPGVYRGKADIEVAGEWQAQIAYEGPAGKGKASFPVMAQ
jgi:nitrogen fixation protein FixH